MRFKLVSREFLVERTTPEGINVLLLVKGVLFKQKGNT